MNINKSKPHVFVLPEDSANRQIANGFIVNYYLKNNPPIQILRESGGWTKVLDDFKMVQGPKMQNIPDRMLVLLIDFDNDTDRLTYVNNQIPEDLKNRVFVLGVLSEPEKLRKDIKKNFEEIGEALAKDCSYNQQTLWDHELLRHNQTELKRLISVVKPLLFE